MIHLPIVTRFWSFDTVLGKQDLSTYCKLWGYGKYMTPTSPWLLANTMSVPHAMCISTIPVDNFSCIQNFKYGVHCSVKNISSEYIG